MPGKYGGQSALFLVDGYNLLAAKLKSLTFKREALQERSDGLGDSAEAHTPTGMTKITLSQDGGFWDTAIGSIHQAMVNSVPTTPQASVRIVCLGFAGQVLGNLFYGLQGAFSNVYDVLGTVGSLTKANAGYTVTGRVDEGVILQPLELQDDDWTGTSVDNGSATTAGGVGYLQIVQPSFGSVIGRIQHSTDNSTWTTLLTFTTASAPSAQRVEVGGTIHRYLRFQGQTFGDISASASISPSSSISPSASTSISPSVSASASASPSRSPSSSLSPSASTSLSPSSSLSPSRSTSASTSPSVSPSSSISPSASSSVSVSPSAGLAGTATVFCGFSRG